MSRKVVEDEIRVEVIAAPAEVVVIVLVGIAVTIVETVETVELTVELIVGSERVAGGNNEDTQVPSSGCLLNAKYITYLSIHGNNNDVIQGSWRVSMSMSMSTIRESRA